MGLWATLLGTLVGGAICAYFVPLAYALEASQPLSVAATIILAAVFVRLNRGMPTLDWKSVDPQDRPKLTSAVVALTREYAAIVAVGSIVLLALIAASVVFRHEDWKGLSVVQGRVVSGFLGAIVGALMARMGYVIWRDYDIVRLQKYIIDAAAKQEEGATVLKAAEAKINSIREAGLKRIVQPTPKPWDG